jgi:hypothetical protein
LWVAQREPAGLSAPFIFNGLGRPPCFPFSRATSACLLTLSCSLLNRFCVQDPSDRVQNSITAGLIRSHVRRSTRAQRASLSSLSGSRHPGERHAIISSIA